jgi:Flp pilus assembly protein protease CpaA
MLLETLLIITAFTGSILAGIIDLKTTEIPDEIPYVMAGIGIIGNLVKSYLIGTYTPILLSFLVGLLFLGFGFLLYFTGQWGGGDAKLLSAIGFLLPQYPATKSFFPFPMSFFFNVFFVGSFYMIGYILLMSFFNRKIWTRFIGDFKASARELVLLNLGIFIFLVLFGIFTVSYLRIVSVSEIIVFGSIVIGLTVGLFTLWRFGKTVEVVGFKREINISELREGDVLNESKLWEGLTKEQIKKIKNSGKKTVVIKEGVRFAPTFALALLVTILLGDIVVWVVGLV